VGGKGSGSGFNFWPNAKIGLGLTVRVWLVRLGLRYTLDSSAKIKSNQMRL